MKQEERGWRRTVESCWGAVNRLAFPPSPAWGNAVWNSFPAIYNGK